MFLHQLLTSEGMYEEGFLSVAPNTGGAGELSRYWPLLLPGPEVRILADKNGRGIEVVYCLYCG